MADTLRLPAEDESDHGLEHDWAIVATHHEGVEENSREEQEKSLALLEMNSFSRPFIRDALPEGTRLTEKADMTGKTPIVDTLAASNRHLCLNLRKTTVNNNNRIEFEQTSILEKHMLETLKACEDMMTTCKVKQASTQQFVTTDNELKRVESLISQLRRTLQDLVNVRDLKLLDVQTDPKRAIAAPQSCSKHIDHKKEYQSCHKDDDQIEDLPVINDTLADTFDHFGFECRGSQPLPPRLCDKPTSTPGHRLQTRCWFNRPGKKQQQQSIWLPKAHIKRYSTSNLDDSGSLVGATNLRSTQSRLCNSVELDYHCSPEPLNSVEKLLSISGVNIVDGSSSNKHTFGDGHRPRSNTPTDPIGQPKKSSQLLQSSSHETRSLSLNLLDQSGCVREKRRKFEMQKDSEPTKKGDNAQEDCTSKFSDYSNKEALL